MKHWWHLSPFVTVLIQRVRILKTSTFQLRELKSMTGSEQRSLRLIQKDCASNMLSEFCLEWKCSLMFINVFMLRQKLKREMWVLHRTPQRKISTTAKALLDYFSINNWPSRVHMQTQPETRTSARNVTTVCSRHSEGLAPYPNFNLKVNQSHSWDASHKRPATHCSGRPWSRWSWEWPGKVRPLTSRTHGKVCGVPKLELVEGLQKAQTLIWGLLLF